MACDNYAMACHEIHELLPISFELYFLSEDQIYKRNLRRLDRSEIIANSLPTEKDVKEIIETDIGLIIKF
jgi:hypothetical protein